MTEWQNLNFKRAQLFHFIWAKLPKGQKKSLTFHIMLFRRCLHAVQSFYI